ncbi:energy-coupling factor transport system ATP-binding protein [Sporobacter termitidis DSM 10068]|uniref:ABC transporter ATP-binding protein n=1 Tax=Sporobacter termitidis DSM 10068 TaxID=1123282 RepID=A0A1M5ZF03_9FIRM|nr:energy-coupling factor transporter ATPase [Sporobacter termitidis]SHI22764.1 energy-coupling factor transport system ATP-binding protein [Sporobacter termitidis DSM 10068]
MNTEYSEKIIKTEKLTYAYRPAEGELPQIVLNGVDLEIEKGTFVAVLGHNGSGKTTLAKHFNAILLPSGGRVLVGGMDTADEELLLEIRRRVGMVFQNPDNQIVANVVEEDVAFAPENLGVPPEEIRHRVDEALKTVGMYEYKTHAPHLLSGGQKQRIAIAGVLAMRPECIVFDEPTAMLDPIGRESVVNIIRQLRDSGRVTVVLITHHMDETIDADRVVVMSDGGIIMDGAPREVFKNVEQLRRTGLDVPETVSLLYELNQSGFDLRLDALSVEECAQEIYAALQ